MLAEIAAICARESISVESLIQHEHTPDEPARIVITTHDASEASMQNALAAIAALETVIKTPQMIRIEKI